MITREQILALVAVLLFVVFITVTAFVRRMISRHFKKPNPLCLTEDPEELQLAFVVVQTYSLMLRTKELHDY